MEVPINQEQEEEEGDHYTLINHQNNHNKTNSTTNVRYRECLKNHAAAIGGNATDGCREFMPGGGDSSLVCCACNCHRNFHRKEQVLLDHHMMFNVPHHYNNYMGGGGGGGSLGPTCGKKRRFRTKFSEEQKEMMIRFAEEIGWKLQNQDQDLVHKFCLQIGISRRVFKVWMHNNKHNLHTIKNKQLSIQIQS